ncbi:MAG: hypothetical protein DMF14_05475 [Verrucomicrobia bacterium]|nr:MAG: hypothetical protein DMF14_05475 [Verrucomicrobiota bacterium]
MYLHSAAATQFTITHSIAPVQVASVQSSCYNGYSTPNGLGATAEWTSPNTSDGFPKTDTPSSARRRQSEPRPCIGVGEVAVAIFAANTSPDGPTRT